QMFTCTYSTREALQLLITSGSSSLRLQTELFVLCAKHPGPNAATLRTIMMSAKRYIPIVTPIPKCIAQMQISQIFLVLLFQMKNVYVISKSKINIPATGNRYFHLTIIPGSKMLKGGRMRARHTLDPFPQRGPKLFVRPLKK